MKKEIIKRFRGNPILTKEDVPYEVETVHNAGVAKYGDGYVMLFRSHRKNGRSIIGIADSSDGYYFTVREKPFIFPSEKGIFSEYEEYGVEDCRISEIDGEYILTYSAYSRHGVRVALAKTKDFLSLERVALVTQSDCRNVVVFPEKIGGRYARLDRPHSEISPWSVWISYSPDLVHWGDSKVVMKPGKYRWDEMKIGPGAPPVKTERGWLNIYHGVFKTMDGAIYRLGAALHDLGDPSKIIGISDDWILQPEDPWEVTGYVHNVVFTCGAVPEKDGTLKIYWGGADTVLCAGEAQTEKIVDLCIDNPRKDI
ncbi:glycoside hydrolase family 130 protein [candidate division WOR-3 bacterium]|nr:glycoside hydrolase family 130 protein [candidate division WOR-3 bacterium]